jgi:hypothetical protein
MEFGRARTSSLLTVLSLLGVVPGCSTEADPSPADRRVAGAAGSDAARTSAQTKPSTDTSNNPLITSGSGGAQRSEPARAGRASSELSVELVAGTCMDGCAELEAVAHGGNPDYSFKWDDGESSPKRRLCATDGQHTVTVKDTPIESAEFGYPGASVMAGVTADLFRCAQKVPEKEPPAAAGGLCIKNPSLEGGTFPGMPPDWTTCLNTPDIGPVGLGIPASDGMGYLGGAASGSPLAAETFEATLCNPLKVGEQVSFQVDLASSTAWGNPGLASMQIWGATESCKQADMLWASPLLDNLDKWKTFCVSFKPSKEYAYFIMVPTVASDDPAKAGQGGYVILDNLKPVEACE